MRAAGWAVAALLLGYGLLSIHGPAVLGGFDLVPGDAGDTRIMAFLLESGWRAMGGEGDFRSPPMFFPTAGTRAFTDAHLLWLPLYGGLRVLGLDMLQSLSALLVLLLAGGYLAALWLFRAALGLGPASAGIGAFLFVFGNALTQKLNHGQLAGVAVLPVILLLLHAAWRHDRTWLAVVAGALTGLLAATSFVVAWFFLFIAGLAWGVGLLRERAVRMYWRLPVAFVGGLVLGLGPFFWIYGAQILHGPRWGLGMAYHYRPVLSDLLNLGPEHPVWGGVLLWFGVPALREDSLGERMMGFSPPVWVLAGLGFWLLRGRRRAELRALAWAAVAAVAVILLQFDYGLHAYAWRVAAMLPGGGAIRTSFRSMLVILLPVAALVAIALQGMRRTWLLLACAVLLDSGLVHPPYGVGARAERLAMAEAPALPQGCAAFALAPGPEAGRVAWMLESDALMLVLHWRVPTLNGNSSWAPDGWALLDPSEPGYARALAAWVRANGLTGVCLYDPLEQRFLPAAETWALLTL